MSAAVASQTLMLFIDSLGSGGAQRQLVTLANGLAEAGYKVYLVTYYPFWHFRDMVAHNGIELIYLPRYSRLDILFVFRLAFLLYKIKPHVVLSYLFTPNVLIRLARLMYIGRCRVITSERNVDLPRSRSRLFVERLMSNLSDAVVTNAVATRDMLIANEVCSQEKIRVIRNGVDVRNYVSLSYEQKSKIRKKLGLSQQSFLLLLPGRVQEQKNHISLLRALTLVPGVTSRCEVLFVGDIIDKNCKHSLDRFVEQYLKGVGVYFVGQYEKMNEVYEIADLVVLPSLYEGMPNVVIESMYKSKLIAISNVSDNAMIIKNGVSGFIHDVDDDKRLAEIIIKVMDIDQVSALRIKQAAHDEFIVNYTVDVMLQNYLDVFFGSSEGNQ